MRKYFTYFKTALKVSTAYKAGLFLGMIVDVIFFIVQFTVWKTIFTHSSTGVIGTYTLSNTITYYFVTNLIFRFDFMNSIFLGWQIWSGNFTNDLVKPWRLIFTSVIDGIAENVVALILSIPVTLILYFGVRQYITFPNIGYFFLFAVTLLLGFAITALFALLLQSLTFYFGDQDANIGLFSAISNFLAGAIVPLAFLPGSILKFVEFLPFKFAFFLPAEIFLQKISVTEVLESWVVGAAWIMGLALALRISFMNGLKFYTGTGK